VQIDYFEYKKFVNNDRAGSICAAFFFVWGPLLAKPGRARIALPGG